MHFVYIGSTDSKALGDARRCLLVLSFLNGLATDMQGDYLAPFFEEIFWVWGAWPTAEMRQKYQNKIVDQHVV